MRRTKEESQATKHQLLDASLAVFSRRGYSATRMEDIAKQANVTTGAIYHHFGGKRDLFVALVEESEARANRLAEKIMREGGTPATQLRRLLVRLFEFLEEDEQYRSVVELFMNKTDNSSDLASITQQIRAGRRILAKFFANLIQDGINAGEFRSDISPEDVGLALVGFLNGMGLIWVQDPKHFSIKQRAEVLVDHFLAGIMLQE